MLSLNNVMFGSLYCPSGHYLFIFFHSPLPLPLLLTYPFFLCLKTNHYFQNILTTFIKKIAQQMNFRRPVFAMAALQEPFLLTHWISYFPIVCHMSHDICPVSAFFWKVWYQWRLPLYFLFLLLFDWPLISLRLHVYFHFLVSAEFQII